MQGPYVKFSQKWAEKKHGERIKRLFRETITLARARKKCPLLLIKVFFYRNPVYAKVIKGHYRDIYRCGGFYEKEWDYGVDSIITLKIGEQVSDEDIAEVFAHELNHHLRSWDGKTLGEKRADKFAKKILERWKKKHAKQGG